MSKESAFGKNPHAICSRVEYRNVQLKGARNFYQYSTVNQNKQMVAIGIQKFNVLKQVEIQLNSTSSIRVEKQRLPLENVQN